ncbi:hypothetical protein NDU88_009107 [Pleurodeles waltl]|uniref:Uncharacterized protein n=1 Tax=Pleurodeles waltl TaxID=8319 RepID=A0AAV7PV20_PLEWA|nr:hypothetical protein NDU88_009107 [Pleurodeles waltl]
MPGTASSLPRHFYNHLAQPPCRVEFQRVRSLHFDSAQGPPAHHRVTSASPGTGTSTDGKEDFLPGRTTLRIPAVPCTLRRSISQETGGALVSASSVLIHPALGNKRLTEQINCTALPKLTEYQHGPTRVVPEAGIEVSALLTAYGGMMIRLVNGMNITKLRGEESSCPCAASSSVSHPRRQKVFCSNHTE